MLVVVCNIVKWEGLGVFWRGMWFCVLFYILVVVICWFMYEVGKFLL